jgi:hypothetical protein
MLVWEVLYTMTKRPKLGRPKAERSVLINMKMSERERDDLRKIAIAHNITMSEFIRHCIEKEKKRLKTHDLWPEEVDR